MVPLPTLLYYYDNFISRVAQWNRAGAYNPGQTYEDRNHALWVLFFLYFES